MAEDHAENGSKYPESNVLTSMLVGASLGFMTMVYSNAVRKRPAMADLHMHAIASTVGLVGGILYSRSYNARLASFEATKQRYLARRAEQRAALEARAQHEA